MDELARRPGAWLPIALSLTALGLVIGNAATVGVAPHDDEGAAARIFQSLMLVQGLIVGWFAIRWVPQAPRPAAAIIVVQLLAASVPIAAILILES
jgi:hypothetical protein